MSLPVFMIVVIGRGPDAGASDTVSIEQTMQIQRDFKHNHTNRKSTRLCSIEQRQHSPSQSYPLTSYRTIYNVRSLRSASHHPPGFDLMARHDPSFRLPPFTKLARDVQPPLLRKPFLSSGKTRGQRNESSSCTSWTSKTWQQTR